MKDTPNRTRSIPVETDGTSRRSVVARVVLGLVAVALLAGMALQFTPNLGGGSGPGRNEGKTVMTVNGEAISERAMERLKGQVQAFQLPVQGGVVAQDIANLMVDQQVLVTAAQQDANRVRIGGNEVRDFIKNLREQRQLTRDSDFISFLSSIGYDDAGFRDVVRKNLQLQKRIEEITKGVTVTDDELKFYFEQNKQQFKNEERIVGRQIVLDKKATATDVTAKIKAGEDFAKLAAQFSSVGKDQDGAMGAKAGEKIPQPIAKVALPAAVADAAFKLTTGGVTDTIEDGGKFYIVKVEKLLPAGQQTFVEAKDNVTEAVKATKGNQAVEAWIQGLQRNAKIEFPKDSPYSNYNPVVAKVNAREFKLSELNREVYFNPQVAQFLQQGQEAGALIGQFFKPQALDNLINQEVAVQAAKAAGQPFVGGARDVLTAAQQYFSRDAKITPADVEKYYKDNIATYSTPASANLTQVTFDKLEGAQAFRAVLVAAPVGDLIKEAAKLKGIVSQVGNVTSATVDPAFNKAVFETAGLAKSGKYQISDIIEKDKKFNILAIENRSEKKVQTLAEVQTDAEEKALALKKAEAGQKWLTAERKKATVTNNLQTVNKELEARAKIADAKRKADEEKARLEAEKNLPKLNVKLNAAATVTVTQGGAPVKNATGQDVTLALQDGEYVVKIEAAGYKTIERTVKIPNDKALNLTLEKK